MAAKERCFIVMPITTPEHLITAYRDGEDHFTHVLECLLISAVSKAGYEPLPPKAKGADLIHAEIVKNLETSDIVLCDISTLNPNVFFEFGIRTSLNKPVCIVKDELTTQVPFDTAILNYYQYNSSIEPWELEKQIDEVSSHIVESITRSKGRNELWKYFGISFEAQSSQSENYESDKLDYLMRKMDSFTDKLESTTETRGFSRVSAPDVDSDRFQKLYNFISKAFPESAELRSIAINPSSNELNIHYVGVIESNAKMGISKFIFNNYAIKANFISDAVD